MNNLTKHTPVMLTESINALAIEKNGIYVDATFGFGGHSKAILSKLGKAGKLYALDKDASVIKIAEQEFIHDKRFTLKHGCFSSLESLSK